MSTLVNLLAAALVFSFILCCALSGILQAMAWSRHRVEGAPVSFRALRQPEQFFDAIGIRQMTLARTLLTVGGVAYLSYGVILVATSVLR